MERLLPIREAQRVLIESAIRTKLLTLKLLPTQPKDPIDMLPPDFKAPRALKLEPNRANERNDSADPVFNNPWVDKLLARRANERTLTLLPRCFSPITDNP
jgi:hypothetical protein